MRRSYVSGRRLLAEFPAPARPMWTLAARDGGVAYACTEGVDAMVRRARGELESEVMAALWAAEGPMTPAGVQAALGGDLAYNTVQTILIRLLDKDLVRRAPAEQGRGHAYWPVQDAATTAATRMRAALEERPDRRAVLQQFADGLGDEDAEVLRALLAEREP